MLETREQRALLKEILKESLTESVADAETVNFKFLKGEKGDEPSDERIQALIPPPIKGEDGHTPTKAELRALIAPLIPPPIKGDPGKDAAPIHKTEIIKQELTVNEELVKTIIGIMKKLPEKDRLEISNLRNANSFVKDGIKYKVEELMHGGASGGSGSTLTPETPVGTVDDSNKTFTVSNTPVYIVVNGAQYSEGTGTFASYVAPTITLSAAVGDGGFITSWYNA